MMVLAFGGLFLACVVGARLTLAYMQTHRDSDTQ